MLFKNKSSPLVSGKTGSLLSPSTPFLPLPTMPSLSTNVPLFSIIFSPFVLLHSLIRLLFSYFLLSPFSFAFLKTAPPIPFITKCPHY